MRTLEFRIHRDKLITKDWSHWKREDMDYINNNATNNEVECLYYDSDDVMIFMGTAENLFNFMHDVAYRYDIEII